MLPREGGGNWPVGVGNIKWALAVGKRGYEKKGDRRTSEEGTGEIP